MSALFYTPITAQMGVRILNPEVIALLLMLRLNNINPPRNKHLKVEYPSVINPPCNYRFAYFHKIIWDDLDESIVSPFRNARFRMEGNADGTPQVFALLENINLDDFDSRNPRLTFSPVPFGIDGKPKLLIKSGRPEILLAVAGIILNSTQGKTWNIDELSNEVQRVIQCNQLQFGVFEAIGYFGELERLGVVDIYWKDPLSPSRFTKYQPLMTALQFETIFGVKLPSIE